MCVAHGSMSYVLPDSFYDTVPDVCARNYKRGTTIFHLSLIARSDINLQGFVLNAEAK